MRIGVKVHTAAATVPVSIDRQNSKQESKSSFITLSMVKESRP